VPEDWTTERRDDAAASPSPAPSPAPVSSPSLEALGRALIKLPHPVIVHRMGIILWVNDAAVTLGGAQSAADLVGRDTLDFVAPEQRAYGRSRRMALLRDGTLPGSSELSIVGADGQRRIVEVMAALMDWEGEPAACMVLWDITSRYDRAEQLRWESTHDVLTQLLNRRGVLDALGTWLAKTPTETGGVGVLIVDLDGFKEVNDTLGHKCGDRVLVEVADQLRRLAGNHLVGRFGGDEFIVALPAASQAEVTSVAEQVAGMSVTLREQEREQLTVAPSVGGVWCRFEDADLDVLLTVADHAMYRAKRERLGWIVEDFSE